SSYEMVRWFADLPAECDCATEVGPGETILSLEAVVSEPAPTPPESVAPHLDPAHVDDSGRDGPDLLARSDAEPHERRVLVAYEAWLGRWHVWAEADRRIAPRRAWYEDLTKALHLVEHSGDEFELVVATGLLSWSTPGGVRIRNHLLATRARVVTDPVT